MSKLVWDAVGERLFETGVSKGALYPRKSDGTYANGVAWNGLTGVTESPGGAELTPLYADDMKYGVIRSAETHGGTIEAYTYPDEFAECDGSKEVVAGATIGQQPRKTFGLCYKTRIGSDTDSSAEVAYKLHLIYGADASPSEKTYQTINESPEAMTLSWEYTTTPIEVTGHKPTASMVIDSTKVDAAKLAALEAKLYGTESEEPSLPMPDEVITMLTAVT